jgi:predicted lactoylglutathione lyase
MPKQIFVNLPVKNLERSKAFFAALGFSFNPQFTDENAACMIIEDGSNYAMLLTEKFFSTFASKPVADATKATEVLIALSLDSRAAVEAMVAKALKAGGTAPRPAKDHGFIYQHGFDDPDGHGWEVFHMSAMPAAA